MKELTTYCDACIFKSTICKGAGVEQESNGGLFELTRQNTYKKGEVIFKQGAKTNNLIFLTQGLVKFEYDNNGKVLIITIDKAKTLLGLANILNEDINLFSIVAIEECKGCIIDIMKFKLQIMNNRMFMFEIMSISTQMFRKSIFNFISIAHKQSNGRVADILLYLSENIYQAQSFTLNLSRQELADFAGCSKELVIHTLQNFSNEGIINVSGKHIEILDIKKLHTISKVG